MCYFSKNTCRFSQWLSVGHRKGVLNMGVALNRLQTEAHQTHKRSDVIAVFPPSIPVEGKKK